MPALEQTMPTWPSHNIAAPSLLYPPDSSKWWMRRNLPGTIVTSAPNGHQVCIVELRGWLRSIPGCNGNDPDWQYELELDVAWLDNLGIAVEALFLPGDPVDLQPFVTAPVNGEVSARSSARAIYGETLIHVELDGWQRTDLDRGQPAKPSTWTFTNNCVIKTGVTAVWPYDPSNPQGFGPSLAPGQYVRMVGSLVTDEPHMSQAQPITAWLLAYGFASTAAIYGTASANAAQLSAIKMLWSEGANETDELNPARYNEMHSPDFIAVLPAQNHLETVRTLAIVANTGLFQGDTEELAAEIPAPPRPSSWHVVNCEQHIGNATRASTVQLNEMTLLPMSVRIHVKVQGKSGNSANGKFFALYRVGWRGIAPRLSVGVSANGSIALTSTDADGKLKARPGVSTAPFWPLAWAQVQSGLGQPGGAVAVVSRAPGFFDAFCVGSDHGVYTAATSGGPWAGWWPIPGVRSTPGSPITAVSRSQDKLDVFVADETGKVVTASWEPSFTSWHGWSSILNGATSPGGAVAAVSRRLDFLDLFVVGMDGHVWTAAWAPGTTGWQGWWTIPGVTASISAPIACVSRSTDKLDLFLSDSLGRVMTSSWSPGAAWSPWTQILGGMTSPGAQIAVASRRTDFLDVFHIGNDGQVYTGAWSSGANAWAGWWPIPGIKCRALTPLVAFSPTQDVLVVVTSSQEGNIMATSWAPGASGWAPWSNIN